VRAEVSVDEGEARRSRTTASASTYPSEESPTVRFCSGDRGRPLLTRWTKSRMLCSPDRSSSPLMFLTLGGHGGSIRNYCPRSSRKIFLGGIFVVVSFSGCFGMSLRSAQRRQLAPLSFPLTVVLCAAWGGGGGGGGGEQFHAMLGNSRVRGRGSGHQLAVRALRHRCQLRTNSHGHRGSQD